jgi:uncharacterized protein YbaP (TraB family)
MLRRRRRPLAVLVGVALLAACAPRSARPPVPPPARAARAPRVDSLLWRVQRGRAVSHVFGTIHMGRALADALGPEGMRALSNARTVVVEIDLDATETVSALGDVVLRRGRLPAGRTLDGLLTPPAWRWVADTLTSRIPVSELRQFQPWLTVYLVIATRAPAALDPDGAGSLASPAIPMDRVITRLAHAHGQQLVALETPAEQIEALAAIPEASAIDLLEEVAREPAKLDRQLRALVNGARGADAAAGVERMVADYVATSPAMAQAVFFDRNARWVPRLVPLLTAGDTFVAVGAGHLVGDRGLVALLQAQGFDLEPVASPTP